jgi:IS30 family transposase
MCRVLAVKNPSTFSGPLESIPVPQRRFAHIHVDLVGPLTPSNGFNHILTVIDRTSRWMEALPLANTAAEEVAAALFSWWICMFGVPHIITSDKGAQFTSNFGIHCVFCCRSVTSQQLHTTPRPTGWWRGYTAA